MREILFRAKRKDNGEWMYGSILPYGNGEKMIIPSNASVFTSLRRQGKPICFFCNDGYDVVADTVGQYTGLTDKNGVKIFEGDIVSFADCWDTQHKGVVYWRSGSYNIDCSKFDNEEYRDSVRLFTAYACGAEIIGNIHDGGIKI